MLVAGGRPPPTGRSRRAQAPPEPAGGGGARALVVPGSATGWGGERWRQSAVRPGHPHLPGILILDTDADGLARNGLDQLQQRWVDRKPQVGAVLVLEREYSAERAYGNVRLLPGPRIEEVSELLYALERCEAGHLHYQPVSSPETPCPAMFAMEYQPAKSRRFVKFARSTL